MGEFKGKIRPELLGMITEFSNYGLPVDSVVEVVVQPTIIPEVLTMLADRLTAEADRLL
jgi:hypothetical protein